VSHPLHLDLMLPRHHEDANETQGTTATYCKAILASMGTDYL